MSNDSTGGMVATGRAGTSVHKSVTVEVGRARAFAVFTEGFDGWWLRSHHIGEADLEVAVMEPREGGRWYERCVDGTECDWGYVMTWEPPERLVLAWQLDGRWQYDPSLVTEVEVTFTEEGPSRTRVDLHHRNIDRMGDSAGSAKAAFESEGGWPGLLQAFAESAESLTE